ncbi:DNA ligase D [Roseiconus nitratireducens]|uniref:DNA ligase (ATP) n=1 Tax=Roseiconus nitratireducens TaxID=2605748 RepID=A0A5M6DDF7_9BACT|nr:DNA ligase D [Roseiconus nitratireducens]KAA5545433.1 DNA ligase D [Roseiconus nitratireducens]
MSLERYRQKRNFDQTPEPDPGSGRGADRSRKPDRFVIHKHGASTLHFDLRLEHDGVLKCWAIPRGPSIDPATRRLAVQTEDHPVSYLDFEGVIPEGNYGAGPMMIWDAGTWTGRDSFDQGLREGSCSIELQGHRLKGRWKLIRTGGLDSDQWLMIRKKDTSDLNHVTGSPREPTITQRTSLVSGKTLKQLTADPTTSAPPSSAASQPPAQRPSDQIPSGPTLDQLPDIQPMLPTPVERPPEGDNWLHELKLDGYRMQIRLAADGVQLLTRNGIDWTDRLNVIADDLAGLRIISGILDGELVALDSQGRADFGALQAAFRNNQTGALVLFVFDLLYLNGTRLTEEPLLKRKQQLEPIVRSADLPRVQYLDHTFHSGAAFLQQCAARDLEGVVSKRSDKPYRGGRTRYWVKTKCHYEDRFVIGGFARSADAVGGLGAIAVGYRSPDGGLVECGKVGGGWTEATGQALIERLEKQIRSDCPFDRCPEGDLTWVVPNVVVSLSFGGTTRDGRLRHAKLLTVHNALPVESTTRQTVRSEFAPRHASPEPTMTGRPSLSKQMRASGPQSDPTSGGASLAEALAGLEMKITSPDRVLFPDATITKAETIGYLVQVSRWILPHLRDRPVSLVRCPQGIGGESFFQRHPRPGTPAPIRRLPLPEETRSYLHIEDLAGLIAAAQMNVIEFHPWGSRRDRIDRPDRLVFDLDPDSTVVWPQVIDAAWIVRETLDRRGLRSFVKTTGGHGLHVVVPIERRYDWDRAAAWCRSVARQIAADSDDRFTTQSSKKLRQGKIYLDHLRNRRGATAIAPYSLRARRGAPVAVPLAWDELSQTESSADWTMRTLPDRLRTLAEDPWEELATVRQRLK